MFLTDCLTNVGMRKTRRLECLEKKASSVMSYFKVKFQRVVVVLNMKHLPLTFHRGENLVKTWRALSPRFSPEWQLRPRFAKLYIWYRHKPPPPTPERWSDGMWCCRSDWPGLCWFCCYQPLCVVSQQGWFGLFLFHKFSNFTLHPPPSFPCKHHADTLGTYSRWTTYVYPS